MKLHRRHLLLSAAASAAACATPQAAQRPARKPNVIIVLADDLGYGDVGPFGSKAIATPALDRMAAEGAKLTAFYASANVCTPSRTGLMTGRYPIRAGLAWQVIQPNDQNGLPLAETTIAEALKPDYATALVGKWHLGHVAPFWPPTNHGFDLFFGLPYSHDMNPLKLYDAKPDARGSGVELTQEDVDYARLTQRFFERGLRFIEDNHDRPFFLMLTLTAPHVPLDPHPDHAGKSKAAEYGDVVEEIDANVGRLIAKLKALGIDQDTLLIVTSDNGPWFEGSTGPLRDRKGGAGWDGGYRVPFLARQPGRIPRGLVNDAMAMNIDLLPTVTAWTGVTPPRVELDGRDMSPLLVSRNAVSPHEELVLFSNELVAAVRTQRWKYVVRSYYRTSELPLDRPDRPDWSLLVDLQSDPEEAYDVSSRYPDVLADMQARVERAKKTFEPLGVHQPVASP